MCIPIDAAGKSGLKRTRKRRDSSMVSERMSSLILQVRRSRLHANTGVTKRQTSRVILRRKLLLTIEAHSDGVKK